LSQRSGCANHDFDAIGRKQALVTPAGKKTATPAQRTDAGRADALAEDLPCTGAWEMIIHRDYARRWQLR